MRSIAVRLMRSANFRRSRPPLHPSLVVPHVVVATYGHSWRSRRVHRLGITSLVKFPPLESDSLHDSVRSRP